MALQKIELAIGETWTPTLYLFSDKKKQVPFNANGYSLVCHIKERLENSAPIIFALTGIWTDELNGVGTVNLTHAQSKTLKLKEYYFQFKIYVTADNSVVKIAVAGILDMQESLVIDIP